MGRVVPWTGMTRSARRRVPGCRRSRQTRACAQVVSTVLLVIVLLLSIRVTPPSAAQVVVCGRHTTPVRREESTKSREIPPHYLLRFRDFFSTGSASDVDFVAAEAFWRRVPDRPRRGRRGL